jgi:putative ABC transport system substrate-binding protein
VDVRRREFITLLSGAAVAWPLAAHAQQPAMPVIGFLHSASPDTVPHFVDAFRRGLRETGYVEGQNVAIEYRWAESQYDRLPGLVDDLVRRGVTVLFTGGAGGLSARAAKAATATIPIVFVSADDPVKIGIVASFNRPGGNATGIYLFTSILETKRLALLYELIPTAPVIAVLINPTSTLAETQAVDLQAAARSLGRQIEIVKAGSEQDFETAFATIARLRSGALLVAADPFFNSRREHLVAQAARYAIPAIYEGRDFALAGGLMTYGINIGDMYRQAGTYAGRVLNGAKPADLPVMQPTTFELVVNLKTAKALGLEVPATLLARSDEVIE